MACDSHLVRANSINEYEGTNAPVMPNDNLNITYPLNNVEASIEVDGNDVFVSLRNNMFEFTEYQTRLDDATWQAFDLEAVEGQPDTFRWTPPAQDVSCLFIRGVNIAGVRSPDVIIDYTLVHPPATANGDVNLDLSVNGLDVETFVGVLLGAEASEVQVCRGDFDGDGLIGETDVPGFAAALVQP